MPLVLGAERLEELLRRTAQLSLDKSDVERVSDMVVRKMNDLLLMGARRASAEDRDVTSVSDLPITKGLQERLEEFRLYADLTSIMPVVEHLARMRRTDVVLDNEAEAELPLVAGALLMLFGQVVTICEPDMVNPDEAAWDMAFRVVDRAL